MFMMGGAMVDLLTTPRTVQKTLGALLSDAINKRTVTLEAVSHDPFAVELHPVEYTPDFGTPGR